MDAVTGGGLPGEAKLRYLDNDLEVLRHGRFVICAVTKRRIPLEDLRYWNVDRQEPYFDAEAALIRWKQLNEES
ncbi:MAG: DUF2093 domain-containing protein [Hyphomonadaceae bacterium]